MKICGSICEYNPLHNGHIKHIKKTKDLLKPDYIVVVMSGNFVQRGEMAILDKYTRSELAILSGADLVIELPTIYAISNAENFAFGGVKLLNDLKVVTDISFGSECGNIETLNKFARFFLDESPIYSELLNANLKQGFSYPKANALALEKFFENDNWVTKKEIEEISNSNNILGIEYLKNISLLNSTISPTTILREKENEFSSAHGIREALINSDLKSIKENVPDFVFEKLENLSLPSIDKLDLLIREKAYNLSEKELENIYDVSEGLHNRIKKALFVGGSLSEEIKTKRYTLAKIKRILLNILFNISKDLFARAKNIKPYAKVLAINENKKELLSIIKQKSEIDLITRKSDYEKAKNKDYFEVLKIDILANYIYSLITNDFEKIDDRLNGIKLIRGEKWKIEKNLWLYFLVRSVD